MKESPDARLFGNAAGDPALRESARLYESRCDLAGLIPILVNEETDVDALLEATCALERTPFEPFAFVVWGIYARRMRLERRGGVTIRNGSVLPAENAAGFSGDRK